MCVTIFRYRILISIEINHFISMLSLQSASQLKTLKTVFGHISKNLEARQQYSTTHCIFNLLLGVCKCGQTQSFLFDTLHTDRLQTQLLVIAVTQATNF